MDEIDHDDRDQFAADLEAGAAQYRDAVRVLTSVDARPGVSEDIDALGAGERLRGPDDDDEQWPPGAGSHRPPPPWGSSEWADREQWRLVWRVRHSVGVGVLLAWLGLNIGFNMYNKWLFTDSDFHFPLCITVVHMLASWAGAAIARAAASGLIGLEPGVPSCRQLGVLVALSVFAAANVGLNNAGLGAIQLSTNQVLRATLPLFVVYLHTGCRPLYGCTGARPPAYSRAVHVVVWALAGAAAVAVYDGHPAHSGVVGVCLTLGSVVAAACWTVLSAGLLSSAQLNALDMVYYSSPFVAAVLLPAAAALEAAPAMTYAVSQPGLAGMYVATGAGFAFVYNVAHYALVEATGALGSAVAGTFKAAALILVSVSVFGADMTWWNVAGIGGVLLLSGAYTWLRFRESSRPPAQVTQPAYERFDDAIDSYAPARLGVAPDK